MKVITSWIEWVDWKNRSEEEQVWDKLRDQDSAKIDCRALSPSDCTMILEDAEKMGSIEFQLKSVVVVPTTFQNK